MTARERPILFSAPMVRAILSGAKTQTRRIVKPDGKYRLDLVCPPDGGPSRCPYGMPGDRLWVKEQTIKVEDRGWIGPVYTESDEGRQAMDWGYGEPDDPDHIPPHAIKRRPSLFMTRAMSRITLEVTEVRVERLQDISEADAMAEGAPWGACGSPQEGSRKAGFAKLWDSINGPNSWDANPWVWAINFKRLA